MPSSPGLARRAILLAVAAAACSSSPIEQPTPPASTARLVPWTLEADGLPPVTRGILDRQENVTCKFTPAADGRLRCLPESWTTIASNLYTDAACTHLAYVAEGLQPGSQAGRFATLPLPRVGCDGQRFEVRRLSVAPADQALFLYDGVGCAPIDVGPTMVATEVVPPESWVAGDEADGTRLSDRLRVRDVATADGARFADHLVDDHWNRTCTLEGDRCWPPFVEATWGALYSDDKCTSRIYPAGDTCVTPALIRESYGKETFDLGPRWSGPVFRGTKGCFPEGSGTATDGPFTKGAQLAADAVAGARVVPYGTGRLQGFGLRAVDGGDITPLPKTLLPYQRFSDTTTGADCEPVWTTSGQVRCLPAGLSTAPILDGPLFADAACTRPAFICNLGPTCAGKPVATFRFDDRGERVDAELHAGVQDLEMAQPFFRQAGACVPYAQPMPLAIWTTDASWDGYALLREKNGPAAP